MRIREYRNLTAKNGLEEELRALWMLDRAPLDGSSHEQLLLWEAQDVCAVLARGGSATEDLWVSAWPDLPVLRRESGGGAVLLGPGCLNYALVLSLERRPALLDVEQSYQTILNALIAALRLQGACAIGSDLVLDCRKFGGHAQRRTRRSLLHHGTILYNFDLDQIHRALREPARQPPYRRGRPHDSFLVNAPVSSEVLLASFHDFAGALER